MQVCLKSLFAIFTQVSHLFFRLRFSLTCCRSEKAFCNFDCHSEKIFAEEEAEETWDKSAGSSPESYQEDLFLLGMHSQETRDIE